MKYNLDEIINIATSESIKPKTSEELKVYNQKKRLNDVERFINQFKLSNGKYTVTKKFLYKAYTMYAESNGPAKSYVQFDRHIRHLFASSVKDESLKLNLPPIKILNNVDNYINNIKRK